MALKKAQIMRKCNLTQNGYNDATNFQVMHDIIHASQRAMEKVRFACNKPLRGDT